MVKDKKLKLSWRKVYGKDKPYYLLYGKKTFIKNKSAIRNFKSGREIRIGTPISKSLLPRNYR